MGYERCVPFLVERSTMRGFSRVMVRGMSEVRGYDLCERKM